MKVKELIEKLKGLDGEKEIGIFTDDCIYDIEEICETEEWFGKDNHWGVEYFIK